MSRYGIQTFATLSAAKDAGAILGFSDDHRYLSNFWFAEVRFDGLRYASVEHAYQAAKTLVLIEREQFRDKITPGVAKRLGRGITMRPDWDAVKLGVMEDLVSQKFARPDLADLLRKTGEAPILELNVWGDRYWGVVADRDGRLAGSNHLGRILMDVRQRLLEA
jgi:ribA/ribD-fused uncharacterized protein